MLEIRKSHTLNISSQVSCLKIEIRDLPKEKGRQNPTALLYPFPLPHTEQRKQYCCLKEHNAAQCRNVDCSESHRYVDKLNCIIVIMHVNAPLHVFMYISMHVFITSHTSIHDCFCTQLGVSLSSLYYCWQSPVSLHFLADASQRILWRNSLVSKDRGAV